MGRYSFRGTRGFTRARLHVKKDSAWIFRVSRETIMHRVCLFDLEHLSLSSTRTDEAIDSIIYDFVPRHGSTTGETYLRGHLKKRRRIRESLNRVDPRNTALEWGEIVSGKAYFVLWLNSLWRLGVRRSLILWQFVIHGCIDGYSRRIIFLHCSTNNLSPTVLGLFDSAIVIAMFFVTSPIVINVPIRGLLAVETMHAIVQWLANLNIKINMTSMFVNKKHRYRTRWWTVAIPH